MAGALCGAALVVVSAIAFVWWTHPTRSAEYNAIYDGCLFSQHGNTLACDAMMRMRDRARRAAAVKAAVKACSTQLCKTAAELLAAGFTKREVVEYALSQGFTERDVADAGGITLEDLQQGKY